MTRVNLTIRRLVVHGRGGFDAEAFGDALRQDVVERLGAGKTLSPTHEVHTDHSPPRVSDGDHHDAAARAVARRLFR